MKREETIDYNIKAAWHSIARMYNQQAAKYQGTMSIGFALLNIHSEEGTPATKIAPLMGLEARSLTRLLKSMEERGLIYRKADKLDKPMEERGLIYRKADKLDKRSVRIYLTLEGKKHRDKSKETVLRFNEVVREEIPQAKLDVFFDVVRSINHLIEENKIYDKVLQ